MGRVRGMCIQGMGRYRRRHGMAEAAVGRWAGHGRARVKKAVGEGMQVVTWCGQWQLHRTTAARLAALGRQARVGQRGAGRWGWGQVACEGRRVLPACPAHAMPMARRS